MRGCVCWHAFPYITNLSEYIYRLARFVWRTTDAQVHVRARGIAPKVDNHFIRRLVLPLYIYIRWEFPCWWNACLPHEGISKCFSIERKPHNNIVYSSEIIYKLYIKKIKRIHYKANADIITCYPRTTEKVIKLYNFDYRCKDEREHDDPDSDDDGSCRVVRPRGDDTCRRPQRRRYGSVSRGGKKLGRW